MKEFEVICIDDSYCGEWLTYGKTYKAYDILDGYNFVVKNNKNWTSKYRQTRFVTPAEWRDIQIDKILNDE
jgi:hypothetical protein